jgi:hypothetical protein
MGFYNFTGSLFVLRKAHLPRDTRESLREKIEYERLALAG